MHLDDPAAYPAIILGGIAAITSAILMWAVMSLPPDENAMDWRAGLRRALAGTDASFRIRASRSTPIRLAITMPTAHPPQRA
jgi:hypothetical protein